MARSQQILCYGSSAHYAVDTSENGGKGSTGSVYKWTVNSAAFTGNIQMSFDDRTNHVIIYWGTTPPGEYELRVNETTNNCTGISQILKITLLPAPVSGLSNQYICVDPLTKELVKKAVLDTHLDDRTYSFKWMFKDLPLVASSSNIAVDQIGNYSVYIVNLSTGCSTTANAVVALSSSSNSTIKISNPFEENQIIAITVLNGLGNYEYSIDGISFQEEPFFEITKAGTYPISVRDKNGCGNEIQLVNAIFHNKFFTPNNDGYNDVWKINGFLENMEPIVTIYDRYGILIKTLNFYDVGWDGTLSGRILPADDYWFVVHYINFEGVPAQFKSHFSLLR